MGQRMISAMIPDEKYLEAKQTGLKFHNIFLLGIKAHQDNPQLIERMHEFETKMSKITKTLDFYTKKSYDLEQELEEVKNGNRRKDKGN